MHNEVFPQIESLLKQKDRILLLTHAKMDGDALGSILAMYLFLKKMGKDVTAVCADPVPESFKFLPTTEVINTEFSGSRDFIVTLDCHESEIDKMKYTIEDNKVNIIISPKKGSFSERDVTFQRGDCKYDLIVILDCPTLKQLGSVYEHNTDMFFSLPIINIDHHVSNPHFGQINYINVTASSTTEILFDLFKYLQKDDQLIDKDIATLLLAGIITDTGSFQNANTTPKALEVSADLYDLGADQQEIIKNIYKTKNLSTLKLWGRVLSKLKIDLMHRIVWSTITKEDFIETQSKDTDIGDVIDELMSNTPGAEIFLLIRESEHMVRGSMRTSSPDVNASKIASIFGGGGHLQAAGFKVMNSDKDFYSTTNDIIEKIKQFQNERLGLNEKKEFDILPAEIEEKNTKNIIQQVEIQQDQIAPKNNSPKNEEKEQEKLATDIQELIPKIQSEVENIEQKTTQEKQDFDKSKKDQNKTTEKKVIDISQTIRESRIDKNNNQ